eukprot:3192184-Pyramimonas_sp.AAC.1
MTDRCELSSVIILAQLDMALASASSVRYHCRPGLVLAFRAPGPAACFAAGLEFRAFLDILGPLLAIFQG